MSSGALTSEQERFAKHDSEAFVEACPGAGKTRTIIARLKNLALALPPRRGIAILSFTNSAVDEFTKRSRQAEISHLLRFPCFVGTFDAFVRHFLILPFGHSATTVRPVIVDSWKSLGVEIRLSGRKAFKGNGVSLDDFDPKTGAIDPTHIGHTGLRKHVIQYQSGYQNSASQRRSLLHRAGYFSARDARLQASEQIQDVNWSHAVGRSLAARFHEIIVDEAQDCNPLDLEILSWLRTHSLRVTVVCDPDQAIYEFRHGTPSNLRIFSDQYKVDDRHSFTGNFRSSNPICALAATLRSRRDPDKSAGETEGINHPILVVSYSGQTVPMEIGQLFLERLTGKSVGLSIADSIIIAHRRRDAQRASGDPLSAGISGQARVEALARSIGEFWSPSATGRTRETAMRAVEKMLLELMGHWQDGDHHPHPVMKRTGLDLRSFRRRALQLVMQVPKTCLDSDAARKEWTGTMRKEVEQLQLDLPPAVSVARFFRHPGKPQWALPLQRPVALNPVCSTIHEAKGHEYEAVCVVLQPDRAPDNRTSQLFDAWERGTELEAKRVIYVGVTRAKRFLMLAVPELFVERCLSILDSAQVASERLQLNANPLQPKRKQVVRS